MTEHLRNISDTAKEALGIQVSGKDRAITDSQGMLQSNVAMRDLLKLKSFFNKNNKGSEIDFYLGPL